MDILLTAAVVLMVGSLATFVLCLRYSCGEYPSDLEL